MPCGQWYVHSHQRIANDACGISAGVDAVAMESMGIVWAKWCRTDYKMRSDTADALTTIARSAYLSPRAGAQKLVLVPCCRVAVT